MPIASGGGGLEASHPASEILGVKGIFQHSERLLATATGIHTRLFANARRRLKQGIDWELVNGEAAYPQKKLTALLALLGVTTTEAEIATLAEKSRLTIARPIEAKVSRFYPNPHLLQVRWTNGDRDHTADIIVTKRRRFRLHMTVPIRLNAHGKYEMARRAPRQRGRW